MNIIEKWVESNSELFSHDLVKVQLKILPSSESNDYKAGISFESESKIGLIEIWGSGACDFVIHNIVTYESAADYFSFVTDEDLLGVIINSYEKFKSL